MAVATEYFKTAAANLRRAALAKRQEIEQLRKAMDEQTRTVQTTTTQMRQEITSREKLAAQPNPSEQDPASRQRADLVREIQQLQTQIIDKQHEVQQLRQTCMSQISQIEADIAGIEREASVLASKS